MNYNSKNISAVAEILKCTSRPHISEGAWQKSCENSRNRRSYEQKDTIYIKEAFLQVPKYVF